MPPTGSISNGSLAAGPGTGFSWGARGHSEPCHHPGQLEAAGYLAPPPRMGSAPPTLQTPLCRQLELNKCSNHRVLKLGRAESSSRPTASSLQMKPSPRGGSGWRKPGPATMHIPRTRWGGSQLARDLDTHRGYPKISETPPPKAFFLSPPLMRPQVS